MRFSDYHETAYLLRPTLVLVKNHKGLSVSAHSVWAFSPCQSPYSIIIIFFSLYMYIQCIYRDSPKKYS